MARLTLTLLGGFHARLGAGPPLALPTKKIQALLAYLALPAGREHSRDKLASLLWGDLAQGHARHSLRQALFAIRQVVEPACLWVDGSTIALNPDTVDVDAVIFERLVSEQVPQALVQAVDLYRGELLDGLTLQEPPFEEWLMAERDRLRELALGALAALLAAQRDAGAVDAALQTGLRLITLDPLQEPVHRTLMRLYARLGRRASALQQYQLCVAVLKRELGVEPEDATKQLYQEILCRQPPSALASGPASSGCVPALGPARHRALPLAREIPLVGREQEMAGLRQAVADSTGGRGRLVIVLGEAGVGKSRLLAELADEVLRSGGRVLLGRCHEGEQILPFGPWVDALRPAGVTVDPEDLRGFQNPWRTELGRLLPELCPNGADLGPPEYLRLFEAVARFVTHLAAGAPLALIVEDLHWADEMSLRLLAFLGHRLEDWPLLLVGTAREEELPDAPLLRRTFEDLQRAQTATRCMLRPLSFAGTSALVRVLTRAGSDETALRRLSEQVWHTSEGNPFVIVESMRAREQGTLPDGDSGLALPARVRAIIVDRVDRLGILSRELLSVAAAIGRDFEFGVIQRAAGLDEPEAAEALEELVRRQVLRHVGDHFDFAHDRIRDVVYAELLPPRRKLLHRRVAEAIEAFHGAALERHHFALGQHYLAGEVWDRAVTHLRDAGIDAVGRSAYHEAIVSFEDALGALDRLPDRREKHEQAVDLHLLCREALNPLGDLDRIRYHLGRAEVLAVTLGDQRRLGEALCNLTQCFRQLGDHTRGMESGTRALRVAEVVGDFGLLVAASQYLAQIHWALGRAVVAKELLARHVDRFEGDCLRQRFGMTGYPSVAHLTLLGACHADLGEFAEAIARGEGGLRVAEEIDHPYTLALACLWLGRVYLAKGVIRSATSLLERGVELTRTHQLGGWPRHALIAALGHALVLSGRAVEGVKLLEEAEERAVTTRSLGRVSLFVSWLTEGYLLAGRTPESAAAARRAITLARDHGERGNEAWAFRVAGQVAVKQDPPDLEEAKAHFSRALTIANELRMRPLGAHCHLGLGVSYRRAGHQSRATAHLTTAAELFREMGMAFWLEKAAAEIK